MATGQTLLDTMELLDQELQLQSTEPDVVRGLIALNTAQDFFESLAAQHPDILGGTIGTVTTAASTEATTFPTGLLRVDRLQFINPTTSRPAWDLTRHDRVGGHATAGSWPWNIISDSVSGRPVSYWTNGRNIYWQPLPDAVHTVRWYGLQAASDITAGGTFAYPDVCILPFAAFATRLMKVGVGDEAMDPMQVAIETFGPLMATLSRFDRDGAAGLEYRYAHDT